MQRFSLFFYVLCFLILGFTKSNAQIALQYEDTLICPGQTIQMCAAFSGEASSLNTDDDFTAVLQIGFPFTFFGNTYTTCVMSDNGFLSFNTGLANQYSAFTWAAAATESLNSVHAAFQDGYLPAGGQLRYQSFGAVGSRRFIAEWCSIPKYGGSCNAFTFTTQIILYETSNIIEIHTTELPGTPGCPSTNGGDNAIQGLRNTTGLINFYPTGRGPGNFWGNTGAINDARRFTPNGAATYTIDSIPFNPWVIISQASSADLVWYAEGQPNLPIANGACATVTPTANINYYTVRYDGGAGCNGGIQSFIDTVIINYGTAYDTTRIEICAGSTYSWFGKNIYAAGNYDTLLSTTLGCDSFLRLQVTVNPLPNVVIKGSSNVEICEGSNTTLALKNPETSSTFQWYKDGFPMAGETGSQLIVTLAGTYTVEATSNKGCKATSEAFRLKVNPNPVAGIEPISGDIICAFDTLTLKAVPGAGYDYRWSPEKAFRMLTGAEGQEVKGVFLDPTTPIILTVYNQFGCYDTATAIVYTKPCCEVFTPNAFSPNGDGSNDFFKPLLQQGQILLTMQIFDRWGKLVYNSESPKLGWNGRYDNNTEAPSDTYMYFIKYTCSDGKLYEKKESVTLIR